MTASNRPTTQRLETLVVDPVNPDGNLAEWQALANGAIDPNPFFGPQFLTPFLENISANHVRLCVIRSGETGKWLMAAPMGRRRLGLGIPATASWATEYGPLGTPLLAPDAPEGTAESFLKLATATIGLPLTAFPYLPTDCTTTAALKSACRNLREVHPEERAAHDSGSEGEDQLKQADHRKRRKEFARLLRRLSEQGEVSLESCQGEAAIAQFEAFLELEASGWKGRRHTALLNHQATANFARQMIAKRALTNGVRIDSISVGGKPIGILVLLIEGHKAFSWKITYDENYARFSPGSQIALYALKQNLSVPELDGADSLAIPGHEMIEPLWRGRMRYATLLCASSTAGRLLQTAGALDLTLERDLRHLARRLLRKHS